MPEFDDKTDEAPAPLRAAPEVIPPGLHGTPEALAQLFGALGAVQRAASNPIADKPGGLKNEQRKPVKYAPLPAVLDAIRQAMTDAGEAAKGLSLVQVMVTDLSGAQGLQTIAAGYGASLVSPVAWVPLASLGTKANNAAQVLGIATTYLRRYGLSGFALIAQDDADADDQRGVVPNGNGGREPTPYERVLEGVRTAGLDPSGSRDSRDRDLLVSSLVPGATLARCHQDQRLAAQVLQAMHKAHNEEGLRLYLDRVRNEAAEDMGAAY